MSVVEGPIEETVALDLKYPSVSERYFTKYYFIPKEKKKVENASGNNVLACEVDQDTASEQSGNESTALKENNRRSYPQNNENSSAREERVSSQPDNSGHTCVMVHTNKLCLITLSHRHPVLAEKKEIAQISYDVGKFNRLDNQVSGKGKRGAQLMGLQSPVCIISCVDGTKYTVLAGVQGKLVEVNERLLSYPQLVSDHPDAEGYLAVVLPPLRNGDFMRSKLFTEEQYKELDHYGISGC
ncbi:protein Abitram-like [Homarus americanus]|uniref:protein Abitram-like n=1 Tax=Homarus americanus TaxID=6706 RepID=UPI001C458B93|nr:protein Abitram-like [Homarus americanus]XP_042222183.1 protein Abitram-like [Homarus americanus]XP_042222184.1 protein Abitram-like [Homarus americanus]